jgi:5-methylcytosine-specific restriction endonuclease McrA
MARAGGAVSRPYITQPMRRAVAERYGCGAGQRVRIACAYCPSVIVIDRTAERVRMRDSDGRYTPELDHVWPLYQGGPHEVDNLVPSCLSCNRSKGPRRPDLAV